MARAIRIGLLWHSRRSKNLGVGALTVGNIAIAGAVARDMGLDPQFHIFGVRDPFPPYDVGEPVGETMLDAKGMLLPGRFAREVRGMDVVLDIGGGDSFAEIYGPKRFTWMALTKLWTRAGGVPLVLSPQTIGPFEKTPYRQIATLAMKAADAVVVRDDKSAKAVRDMTAAVTPVDAIDVAFALGFERRAAGPADRVRVGLNVSGLLWNGGYSGRGEFNLGYDYRALTLGLLNRLSADPAVDIELITHACAPGGPDDDGPVADELAARYPRATRVPDFPSPAAAKGWIAGLDLLVAARMHATIAAYSSGVPVVPVSYSRKFEGLFGTLGYDWLVPHRGMDAAGALALLDRALASRPAMQAQIEQGLATVVQPRLDNYRAVLRRVFATAAR